MTMKKLVLAAICAFAVAGCSSGPGNTGTANRQPLQLPDAGTFEVGTCSTIAEPVLALGRITYEKAGVQLTDADRAALVVEGEKLVTARAKAEPELAEAMMNVLMHIGFVRIRTGKAYDPQLLADVETARQKLQTTCTT
jgi:hypothetical protein